MSSPASLDIRKVDKKHTAYFIKNILISWKERNWEGGTDLARQYGIPRSTLYAWKKNFMDLLDEEGTVTVLPAQRDTSSVELRVIDLSFQVIQSLQKRMSNMTTKELVLVLKETLTFLKNSDKKNSKDNKAEEQLKNFLENMIKGKQ